MNTTSHLDKIEAMEKSVATERKWINFMESNNFPTDSAKMVQARGRLAARQETLNNLLNKQNTDHLL